MQDTPVEAKDEDAGEKTAEEAEEAPPALTRAATSSMSGESDLEDAAPGTADILDDADISSGDEGIESGCSQFGIDDTRLAEADIGEFCGDDVINADDRFYQELEEAMDELVAMRSSDEEEKEAEEYEPSSGEEHGTKRRRVYEQQGLSLDRALPCRRPAAAMKRPAARKPRSNELHGTAAAEGSPTGGRPLHSAACKTKLATEPRPQKEKNESCKHRTSLTTS